MTRMIHINRKFKIYFSKDDGSSFDVDISAEDYDDAEDVALRMAWSMTEEYDVGVNVEEIQEL